ncbi:MAG: hypothetical protein AB1830_13145 [Pseudomonadota bacterium]
MAYTMQTLLDLARYPLQDAKKTRWTDAEALDRANKLIARLRQTHPHLFVGKLAIPHADLALGSAIPFDDEFLEPVAQMLTARLLMDDAEHSESGKAAAHLSLGEAGR